MGCSIANFFQDALREIKLEEEVKRNELILKISGSTSQLLSTAS